MSFSDPLSDLITRIRNAQMIGRKSVKTPSSKLRTAVLNVLKQEGYIKSFHTKEITSFSSETEIELKYLDGSPVISEIERVSKPSRRKYEKVQKLPKVYNGLGVSILSTSKGVIPDHEARHLNVGGEILIRVF